MNLFWHPKLYVTTQKKFEHKDYVNNHLFMVYHFQKLISIFQYIAFPKSQSPQVFTLSAIHLRVQTQPACPGGPGPSLVPIARSTAVYLHLTEGMTTASRTRYAEGKNNNQIFKKLISVRAYQLK